MFKVVAVFAVVVDGIERLLGDEGRDVLVALFGCGGHIGLAWLCGRHGGRVRGVDAEVEARWQRKRRDRLSERELERRAAEAAKEPDRPPGRPH